MQIASPQAIGNLKYSFWNRAISLVKYTKVTYKKERDWININSRQGFNPFLIKNLEGISPFCGATDTPVLDFWWHVLWVWKPEWAALPTLGRGICVACSLRFTSGATPAEILGASMAAELISSMYHTCKQGLVWLKSLFHP